MIDHYNQQALETTNIKRKEAEDLLAGLLVFRTDLGSEGEKLIHLLLDAGITATDSDTHYTQSIQNILH